MAKRVLIVDDEWQTVELVRIELVRQGYDVATASNGAECLLAVDQSRPDLIVLDVAMPVLDGYRVLEVIKEKPETAAIPVIMLTARRADRDVTHSVKGGADLHLSKPFEIDELVVAVRALLTAEGADADAGAP